MIKNTAVFDNSNSNLSGQASSDSLSTNEAVLEQRSNFQTPKLSIKANNLKFEMFSLVRHNHNTSDFELDLPNTITLFVDTGVAIRF